MKIDGKKTAELAMISLTDAETIRLSSDMDIALRMAERLRRVRQMDGNPQDICPLACLREDKAVPYNEIMLKTEKDGLLHVVRTVN